MIVKKVKAVPGVGYVAQEKINIGDPVVIDLESQTLELDKPYSDKQLNKEFPERERICKYDKCKKKFLTRFDAKYHSDKCFIKDIRALRKQMGIWKKNGYKDRVKSTHRPDKNPKGDSDV